MAPERVVATNLDAFRKRQSAALRSRIGRGFPIKLIATEIGVHPDTIQNWASGQVTMPGAAIEAVNTFFARRGDHDFLSELYSTALVPAGGSIAICLDDRCLWFTGDGAMHMAAQGHAAFVSGILGLPAGLHDAAAYAIRNMGWVEALVRPDGHARLRYSEDTLEPAAGERAKSWVERDSWFLRSFEVGVLSQGIWKTSRFDTALQVLRHIDHAVATETVRRLSTSDWNIERRSLSALDYEPLAKLHAMVSRGVEPLKAVVALGLLETSSVFAVDGTEVLSLWMGTRLGLPRELIYSRNILCAADKNYASLVHHHVLEAGREKITYYRLHIEIFGSRRSYERVAFLQPGGVVITSSRLLDQKSEEPTHVPTLR